MNLGLNPARSRHYETGLKWRDERVKINVDVFHVTTWDEIAVLASSGGRTVYYNAGKTHRDGAEAEMDAKLPYSLHAAFAYTWLRAVYDDPANRIPAIPQNTAYAELSWAHAPSGLGLGIEGRWVSDLYADDANTQRAPGYVVANVRATLAQNFDRWRLQEYFRLDNIADRKYVGSVIVNESNQRYFEPAPGRTWLLGFNAALRM
jgi:iron complex outermembrane receptor protein